MACKISEKYDPCIYQIKNLINNKVYIGSTYRFRRRKRLHKYKLNSNSHKNAHLQRAWNKYGKNNFIFEILELFDFGQNFDKSAIKLKLLEREQYYIDKLESKSNNYNIRKLADSNLGIKVGPMKDEHKKKIGNANRRFNNIDILKMFDLSKQGYTNEYISKIFKLDSSQISRILNGRHLYSEFVDNIPPINTNIKPNKLDRTKIINIYNRLKDGELSKDLEKEYLVDQSTISRIKTKKRNYSWLETVK